MQISSLPIYKANAIPDLSSAQVLNYEEKLGNPKPCTRKKYKCFAHDIIINSYNYE